MRRVLLAQAACLALCGHGAGPTEGGPSADGPSAGSTSGTVPSAEIFFPRAFSAGFEAEGIGKLVVDGAVCPRLRLGSGESTAPLWMRGRGLETADGGPRVLDAGGRTHGAGAAGALPWRLRPRLRPRVRAGRSCRGDRLMYCRAGEGILRLRKKSEQRRTL
jgi:hypothetical protein